MARATLICAKGSFASCNSSDARDSLAATRSHILEQSLAWRLVHLRLLTRLSATSAFARELVP